MAYLMDYHDTCEGCSGKTYARQGFDVGGYWTENGREQRPPISEGIGGEIECGTNEDNGYCGTSDFVDNYLEPEIRKVFDEGFFKYQRDASIDFDYPVEIISQVFKRGWYNNGGREKLIYLFNNIFTKLGIEQNDSCGNHINISKALFINDRSAWLFDEEITNNYEKYLYIFGRTDYEGQRVDNTYYEQRKQDGREDGHYTAVNWAHWDEGSASRLELRIVGKAQSGEQYCGYIDTIFALIDKCNAQAKAEKKSAKKKYRWQTILYYDADGNISRRRTVYTNGYIGTYYEEEKND